MDVKLIQVYDSSLRVQKCLIHNILDKILKKLYYSLEETIYLTKINPNIIILNDKIVSLTKEINPNTHVMEG